MVMYASIAQVGMTKYSIRIQHTNYTFTVVGVMFVVSEAYINAADMRITCKLHHAYVEKLLLTLLRTLTVFITFYAPVI